MTNTLTVVGLDYEELVLLQEILVLINLDDIIYIKDQQVFNSLLKKVINS
jgi:hypothetical protein